MSFTVSGIRSRSIVRRVAVFVMSLALGAAIAAPAMGQSKSDSEMDARLLGYDGKVGIEKDSTTPLWFVFFILVLIACGALFKTAKRE